MKQEEAHPRPDTAMVMNKMVITSIFFKRLVMQVNTDVLDTVLLSLHPAEVNTDKKIPTNKDQESPFQGDCGD